MNYPLLISEIRRLDRPLNCIIEHINAEPAAMSRTKAWVEARLAQAVIRRVSRMMIRLAGLLFTPAERRSPCRHALRGVPWAGTKGCSRLPRNATEGVPYRTKSVTNSLTAP